MGIILTGFVLALEGFSAPEFLTISTGGSIIERSFITIEMTMKTTKILEIFSDFV